MSEEAKEKEVIKFNDVDTLDPSILERFLSSESRFLDDKLY